MSDNVRDNSVFRQLILRPGAEGLAKESLEKRQTFIAIVHVHLACRPKVRILFEDLILGPNDI